MKSLSPCGDRALQSTSFHSMYQERLLSMHVSFMELKRYYSSTRMLRLGFSLWSLCNQSIIYYPFLIHGALTLVCRPASLQLPRVPRAVYSSPDGSCALAIQEVDGVSTVTAYHWSTFASTSGIFVQLPDFPVDLSAARLTSMVHRNNIHIIGLDLESRSCRSVILSITRKETEFAFQERRFKGPSSFGKRTVHNCLIECHADVWTSFPVVPAVKRHTTTSPSERQQKTLVFVTDDDRRPFSSHFSDIIHSFERASRKPTGNELRSIAVSARTFPSFVNQFLSSPDWPVSCFRVGEWLADLLCLIPIHIANTHENRFVPLKDGVVSTQLEKALLGAEVNKIVDSLSLGWYESIFQSYWALKVEVSFVLPRNVTYRIIDADSSLSRSFRLWESNWLGRASLSIISSILRFLGVQCGQLVCF